MPYLSVELRDRNHLPVRGDEAPYKLVPKRFSKSVLGGCKTAEIQVTGGPTAVWEVVDFLRYGVTIRDSLGERLWWGYVNSIEIEVGKYRFGVTLDTMGNLVAIAYGRVLAGAASSATRATTPYASDPVSVGTYGTKERLLSVSSATDSAALKRRDQELDANRLPVPTIQWAGKGDGSGEVRATMTCKGWWHTLDWRYASQPQDVVQHTETNADEVFLQLRTDAVNAKLAQSFVSDPSNAWSPGAVQLRMRRKGAPTLQILVTLQSNSGGNPDGIALDSAVIDSSALDSSVSWIVANFVSGSSNLTLGITYWLVIEILSGTTDSNNYVEVEASKFDVYTAGAAKKFNGSWQLAHATDNYDFLFIVSGVRETTRMMKDIIVQYGPFFTGTMFPTPSQVFTNAYLDGDSTAREEIEELMDIGSSSLRRYIADVDPFRTLSIYEEPTKTLFKYYLNAEGRIFNTSFEELPARYCPVGYWAKLDGVIPSTANVSALADPSIVFIDEAEYDVERDIYIPSPRSLGSVWSQLGKIRRV